MRIRVWPYKQGSKSAAALADALAGRVLLVKGSAFKPEPKDVVINWGSASPIQGDARLAQRILNDHEAVNIAGNKLLAFQRMKDKGVSIPLFCTRPEEKTWEGDTVARHVLRGHSGVGIEILPPGDINVRAPLYVQYIPKKNEYRVHVVGQSIIAVQRKARDEATATPNWKVRNHANGFIFVRGGFQAPTEVLEQAMAAIKALGLDFGAVDIVFNDKQARAYVLEVNTAPGLEGQTINDYAQGFRSYLQSDKETRGVVRV